MKSKRDIRSDLRERIDAIDAEIQTRELELDDLVFRKESLEALLKAEDQEWSGGEASRKQLGPNQRLSSILMDLLQNGETWSGKTLAAYAQKKGFDFDNSSPGRVTHSTLVGMSRTGIVKSLGGGRWKLPKGGSVTTTTE